MKRYIRSNAEIDTYRGENMDVEKANTRIKDRPNKVRAKLIIDVESEFYDDEATTETLRYCVEQDLEDAGLNVIDVQVVN